MFILEKDLSIVLPEFIKLELLKDQITKVYKTELELINVCISETGEFSDSPYFAMNFLEYQKLKDGFEKFLSTLQLYKISDDSLKTLYKFCKVLRKDLNLEDNLYNVPKYLAMSGVIEDSKEINEKVNQLKSL